MISSEVQRTLVKSPPELWAELSDPAALARHLGELGEIRITRTEPEHAVEWEATAADGGISSGKVQIAPSGWGTKVTFSATRAVANRDAAPPSVEQGRPAAVESMPEAPPEDGRPSRDQALREQAIRGQALRDRATRDRAFSGDEAALAGPALAEEDAFAVEPQPKPATQQRCAAEAPQAPTAEESEPEPAPEPEPAGEVTHAPDSQTQLLGQAPAAGGRVDFPERARLEQLAPAGDRAPKAAPEVEPRRSFFARLFGRLRKQAAGDGLDAFTTTEPSPESDEGAVQAPPPRELSAMATAARMSESREALATLGPAEEELATVGPDAPATAEAKEPAAVEPEEPAILEAKEPAAVEPEAPATVETDRGAGAETGALTQAHAGKGLNIPTEPGAAEEVAAEQQVTAVLTAALDRLGAAHHRPFSRA
jgi:hypothetical protein